MYNMVMALVKRGGRPLKFTDPEKFAEQVDAYFDYCDENDKPYTMSGLGVYLDTSADTLIDYSKKDDFSETIKKAKERNALLLIEGELKELFVQAFSRPPNGIGYGPGLNHRMKYLAKFEIPKRCERFFESTKRPAAQVQINARASPRWRLFISAGLNKISRPMNELE